MSGFFEFLTSVGLTVGFMVVGFLLLRRYIPVSTSGVMHSRSDTGYGYVYGNNLKSYTVFGTFHGIDIRLPVDLPHIYLDSLKAGGNGVNTVLDESQRINLEGDFPKYFNVFVPSGHEAVALSILTPDVMQVMKDHASQFDVEIFGDHLRIISNRRVFNDQGMFHEIMQVADVLLKEIEDRARSWSEANSQASSAQDLRAYPRTGFRIFGRYATWMEFWLLAWWLMCTIGIFAAGIAVLDLGRTSLGWILIVGSVVLTIVLMFYGRFLEAVARFWSRRG